MIGAGSAWKWGFGKVRNKVRNKNLVAVANAWNGVLRRFCLAAAITLTILSVVTIFAPLRAMAEPGNDRAPGANGTASGSGVLGLTHRYRYYRYGYRAYRSEPRRRSYRRAAYRRKLTRRRSGRRASSRVSRKTRARRARVAGIWRPEVAPEGPVQIVVSLLQQRVDVYRAGVHVARSRISTGRPGYRTPKGIFSILQKNRVHFSNLYNNAPMPHMQRLTWSGIALHGGPVPNYPASHGCIRLPYGFAKKLFALTRMGEHVVVADGTPVPLKLSHPNLIQPKPFGDVLAEIRSAGAVAGEQDGGNGSISREVSPAETALLLADVEKAIVLEARYSKRSSKPLRILITRRTQRERVREAQRILNELGYDAGPVDGAVGKQTRAAIRRLQGALGLRKTGTVNKQLIALLYRLTGRRELPTGQLYVRQGYKDILQSPVVIKDPELPLGTHLFTVMAFDKKATTAQWTALTLEGARPQQVAEAEVIKSDATPPGSGATAATAMAALDRVVIPDAVRERLSELLTPGSSLIITDNGISSETGKYTDFIVRIR